MFKHILVAVDGSATANRGLSTAIELAADQRATLHVLHVVDDLAAMPAVNEGFIPADYIEGMLKGIVGFALPIARLDGKWKMSQNRPAVDRASVVSGLQAEARDDVAALIQP